MNAKFQSTNIPPRQGHVLQSVEYFQFNEKTKAKKLVLMWGGSHGLLKDCYELRDDQWFKTSMNVSPKGSCASCSVKECIYMYGGMESTGYFSQGLWRYNAQLQIMEEIAPASTKRPLPLIGASLIHQPKDNCDGYLYLFGGLDHEDRHQRGVWRFDISNRIWEQQWTKGLNPFARESHSACYYKNYKGDEYMIVYGGFFYSKKGVDRQKDLLFLDLNTLEWTTKKWNGYFHIGRAMHSAVIYKDVMYVYGGYVRTGSEEQPKWERSNELYCCNLVTETWELIKSNFGEPRAGHRAAIIDNMCFIVGGVVGVQMQQEESCTSEMISFALEPPLPPVTAEYKYVNSNLELSWKLGDFINSRTAVQLVTKGASFLVYNGPATFAKIDFSQFNLNSSMEFIANFYAYPPGSEQNREEWSQPFRLEIPALSPLVKVKLKVEVEDDYLRLSWTGLKSRPTVEIRYRLDVHHPIKKNRKEGAPSDWIVVPSQSVSALVLPFDEISDRFQLDNSRIAKREVPQVQFQVSWTEDNLLSEWYPFKVVQNDAMDVDPPGDYSEEVVQESNIMPSPMKTKSDGMGVASNDAKKKVISSQTVESQQVEIADSKAMETEAISKVEKTDSEITKRKADDLRESVVEKEVEVIRPQKLPKTLRKTSLKVKLSMAVSDDVEKPASPKKKKKLVSRSKANLITEIPAPPKSPSSGPDGAIVPKHTDDCIGIGKEPFYFGFRFGDTFEIFYPLDKTWYLAYAIFYFANSDKKRWMLYITYDGFDKQWNDSLDLSDPKVVSRIRKDTKKEEPRDTAMYS